jgi:hypothetical protein
MTHKLTETIRLLTYFMIGLPLYIGVVAAPVAALSGSTSGTPLSPTNPSTSSPYDKIDQEIQSKATTFCNDLYPSSGPDYKTRRSFCESTFISQVRDDCRSSRTSVSKYTDCARKDYSSVESTLKDKQKADAQAAASSCADNSCGDPALKCNQDKCDFIGKYINPAITAFTAAFGIIAVISLILGGITYASSAGDPQKVAAGKKRIFNTIVAIVAYFFLYGFLQFLIPGGLFNRGS